MTLGRGWSPWENSGPLEISFSRMQWLGIMKNAFSRERLSELVLKHRIFQLQWLSPAKHENKDQYVSLLPLFRPQPGHRYQIASYLLNYVGLGTEHENRVQADQEGYVPALLGVADLIAQGSAIPQESLSAPYDPIAQNKKELISLDHEARDFFKGIPFISSIYLFGLFNPDHPQAEAECVKYATGDLGNPLTSLAIEALARRTLDSPAMTRVLGMALESPNNETAKASASRLAKIDAPDLQVQMALFRLIDHKDFRVSGIGLDRIKSLDNALDPRLAQLILEKYLGSADLNMKYLLADMKPLPRDIADKLVLALPHVKKDMQVDMLHIVVDAGQGRAELKPMLLSQALDQSSWIRKNARQRFQALGIEEKEKVEFIRSKLGSSDLASRLAALRFALELGIDPTKLADSYLEALTSDRVDLRMASLEGLLAVETLPEDLFAALMARASTGPIDERAPAMKALARTSSSNDAVLRLLLRKLNSNDPLDQKLAEQSLPFLERLSDESAYSLSLCLGIPGAKPVVIDVLEKQGALPSNVLRVIVEDLAKQKNDSFHESMLLRLLNPWLTRGAPSLATILVQLLGHQSSSGTAHGLLSLRGYYQTLPEETIDPLLELSRHRAAITRGRARMALRKTDTGNPKVVAALVAGLNDDDLNNRENAVYHIENLEITDPIAIDQVRAAISDGKHLFSRSVEARLLKIWERISSGDPEKNCALLLGKSSPKPQG